MTTHKKLLINRVSGKSKDTSTSTKSKKSYYYRLNSKKLKSHISGPSLRGLISEAVGLEIAINPDDVQIFRKLRKTGSPWTELQKSEFAFHNKYYDLQKSEDGTGFYYVWEWDKKNPLEHKPILENKNLTNKSESIVVDVIPQHKTSWQKIKLFFINLFN